MDVAFDAVPSFCKINARELWSGRLTRRCSAQPSAQVLLCFVLTAGGYDSDLEGALASGHVGSPVQPADRALLRLRPLRHYAAGELVAVKRRSNTNPAAAAAAVSSAAVIAQIAAGDAGGGDAEGAALCYGRVAVDAAPAAGQAAYRLSVEVEPGVYQTLLSTQVRRSRRQWAAWQVENRTHCLVCCSTRLV